jgi:hypothetical protein
MKIIWTLILYYYFKISTVLSEGISFDLKYEFDKIRCGEGDTYCASSETCCKTGTDKWSCCPYEGATCCADMQHCCPQGFKCNLELLMCIPDLFLNILFSENYNVMQKIA